MTSTQFLTEPQHSCPLKIGDIQLEHPFVQAALSGYSDWPMRAMAREYGAAYTIAEVMIDRFANEAKANGKTQHHFHVAENDHPVGAQLMGSDPENFSTAAVRLVAAGFDVIDVNFGCPVKSAIGGCRGGYHLGQPKTAIEILQRVRDAVPDRIPVTLKMRRGIDDSQESDDNFFTIFDAAFALGFSAVTVHGRTVVQKYNGPSSWEFLRKVKAHAGKRTVLGSGDLFSAADCVKMLRQTGVDGVTIARGAIGNPWIFRQSRELFEQRISPSPPTIHEQKIALIRHRGYADQMFLKKSLGVIKKFGFKYARLHPETAAIRSAFQQMRTEDDWQLILKNFYEIDGPGQFPVVDETQSGNS